MAARPINQFLTRTPGPVYVVAGERSRGGDELRKRLQRGESSGLVETVTPDSVSALESAAPAAVVCCCPGRGAETVERVVATGVDCPVLAVGGEVDPAAAYDAGAAEVVPLDAAEDAETVAQQIRAVVGRDGNERLLSELIDETADGLVIHDPETGEVLACNDRYYEMLGYDPTAVTVTLDEITGDDGEFTRDRAIELIRRAAAGTPATFEWKPPKSDGAAAWMEVKLEGATLADERFVIASVRDIEARKERERELDESRTTFRRLHEITSNPDLDVDERVRELLAFGAAELDMDIGFLSRIDREAGEFEVIEAEGDHPLIQSGSESALEETYCRRVVGEEGDPPVAVRDAAAAGMADDPAYERFGLGCYLGAKIVVDGELYGTLCFADEEPRREPFSQMERTLIDHMAQWLRQEFQEREYVREVEATQRRQRRMLSRIDDGFFALDTEWRVQYVNGAGAAVLRGAMDAEYDDEELVGRHLWDEIPDAVGTTFYEKYHRAMDEQRSVSFEQYYEPLDVWFEVRAYPDADGLSVYFTDITERKEREQELVRYETILESLDDAVYALESDGTISYVNEQYAAMKGVDREELIGTSVYEWVDEETAERADAVRRELEAGTDGAGTDEAGTFEYDFRSVDGETTPVEMRFGPVVETHTGDRRVGVIRDISERKERERELYIKQRALEEASIPLTMSDPNAEDNPLVYVNDAFEELTGYDAAEAVGRNCRFLQGPETDPEVVDEIRAAVDAEEPLTTELRNYRADGTAFWNWLSITPIYDEDGTLLRFLGSQRDVSEQHRNRRVRRELLSTTGDLMNADSRGEIAETVSAATASVLGYDLNVVYLRADGADEPSLGAAARSDAVGRRDASALGDDPADPVQRAFETGEPVVRTDDGDGLVTATDPRSTVSALLAVPIGDHGVLAVASDDPAAFTAAETDRVQLLTVNATAAFDRMERTEELEQYETLFETVRDKLYVVDENGVIERVSRPLAEVAGYDPAELRGEHISALLTEETVSSAEGRVLDLLVTPDTVSSTCEGAVRSRDGGETPVEIELSLLPYDDRFRGTVGAVRDISERRERERRLRIFREALTEAGVGLAMYGESGRFEYVNDHYARLLGRPRDEIETDPVWEAFGELSRQTFDSYWESFALGETRTRETEHRRDDGSTVSVETITTAVEVEGTRHHILTVRDITERQERQQQSEVLQRLIRHNLRNDLTVILGHSQMLESDLDGSNRDSAATINETATNLRGLTETVQEAQDVIGRETVRKPVDAVELLEDEIARLRSESAVTVETDLPQARFVLADVPLRQAFRQLFANVVEHSDKAEPTVWVRVADAGDRSGWVDIEIADDGPGIPEYEVATLTAGEETSLQHGSGIGLWVIYWAVTRYGGDLEFEARDEGGSLVRIRLPAAGTPEEGEEAEPAAVPGGDDGD
jgi:PAS domain S-box-containing protein